MADTDTRSASPPEGNLLERLLDEVEQVSDGEAPPPPPPPPPGGSSPLGAILSNPALLSALPALMENLSPRLGLPEASTPPTTSLRKTIESISPSLPVKSWTETFTL